MGCCFPIPVVETYGPGPYYTNDYYPQPYYHHHHGYHHHNRGYHQPHFHHHHGNGGIHVSTAPDAGLSHGNNVSSYSGSSGFAV